MDPGLDFASLLGIAEHVSKDKSSNEVRLLKTKFDGPKKEKRVKGKLNVNVQKFLEKKDAEERQKKLDKKKQLKNLQEMRTESAKNKIAKHLKVTKSANKAVISEAVNKRDTAVTLTGRQQCDEDDYGFVSNTSNSLYEKLMGKYEATPDDPMSKFSKAKPKSHVDINSTKERIKMALKQEEEPVPRTRKRKHADRKTADEEGVSYKREVKSFDKYEGEKKEEKGKKERDRDKYMAVARRKEMAKKAPKPLDFQSLMQVAHTVKDKPVVVTKPKDIKEAEFGDRPMTKRQRDEYVRENQSRLRREGKLPKKESPPPPPPVVSKKPAPERKEDHRRSEEPIPKIQKVRRPEPGPQLHAAVRRSLPPPPAKKPAETRKSDTWRKDDRKYTEPKGGAKPDLEAEYKKSLEKIKLLEEQMRQQKVSSGSQVSGKARSGSKEVSKPSSKYSSSGSSREYDRKPAAKSSDYRKRDISEVSARQFPGEKVRKKEKDKPRKMRIESDSEYDSEMDDFIDDADEKFDFSKEIKSIFGYDRNKYRDEPDFDDRSMENNRYSSIMQEEVRSAKIGRMEDLEDMRREEEENKRKRMRMKNR